MNNPRRVDIYFQQFIDETTGLVGGGGIGTLISYLCPVFTAAGFQTTVYQCARQSFETAFGDCKVIGAVPHPGPKLPNEQVVARLCALAAARAAAEPRIELFAADYFSQRSANPLAIAMQNGLAWDAAIDLLTKKKLFRTRLGEKAFRLKRQYRGLGHFENCYNRVAVDLYFINWYRSFRGTVFPGRIWYNPNPAGEIAWDDSRARRADVDAPVRLIFARRLVPEKGTRLIAAVFADLLRLRPNIEIMIAGGGRDQQLFAEQFAGDKRVTVGSYAVQDTLAVHRNFDIAVIPSLCGEATCLSVVEAMAAGCAVVATNMGGMITQIIDGYNGRLCWPNQQSLLDAILWLSDHPAERLTMQRRGWEVARCAFGMAAWQARWQQIIREVVDGREQAAAALKHRAGARP